jgi:hypothetical protein
MPLEIAVVCALILSGAISAEYINGIKNNPIGNAASARK